MKRSYLKLGDKSSVGGTVLEGMQFQTHHGTALTFLGATVECPSCKTTGHIIPKGPRWPNNIMGKEAAFDGDLCACKCTPPPVMKASQNDMYQSFETHELTAMGFSAEGNPLEQITQSTDSFDEQIRVLGSDGLPISGVPFHIKTEDGIIYKGVTDEEGCSPRIHTSDVKSLDIAVGYKAVERWNS